jgi:hypothetical protein
VKIELKEISVRDLTDGYLDNEEAGVLGYSGELDIRPPFQREFIYRDKQRDAVIATVTKDFPLNVMYWAVRDEGGMFPLFWTGELGCQMVEVPES